MVSITINCNLDNLAYLPLENMSPTELEQYIKDHLEVKLIKTRDRDVFEINVTRGYLYG